LTRTIGTVTGAALLTLIFNTIGNAGSGAGTAAGFLAAFAFVFKLVGATVGLSAVAVPWWRKGAAAVRREVGSP
jgi:hypothetical protein